MNVAESVAVVTGGASGIGRACAEQLTAAGSTCVLLDLAPDGGPLVAQEVGARFVHADVCDEEAVGRALDLARSLGPVRVLVNAAGIGNAGRTLDREGEPLPMRRFEKVLRVNLSGTFNVLRLTAAAMAREEPLSPDGLRGTIVNIASVAAMDGQIGQGAYAASKGGICAMTLPIARDLASVGIRVNTVAPGLIDTPIYGEGERAEELKAKLASNVLCPKRLGTADELATTVIHVIENDYLNGEVIRVDGGVRLPPR